MAGWQEIALEKCLEGILAKSGMMVVFLLGGSDLQELRAAFSCDTEGVG